MYQIRSTWLWLWTFFSSKTQHAAHLLELVDSMCKHETDLASIIEDTEQSQFSIEIDGRMDGQMDGQTDSFIDLLGHS